MDDDTSTPAARRTVFPADEDTLALGAWVSPPRCGNCGGDVDTWYRYDRPDDARCRDCGQEWTIGDA
jgi:hypothetical protein